MRDFIFSQGILEVCKIFEQKQLAISELADSLWCPVRTVPLHEVKLYNHLKSAGITAYLPLVPAVKVHRVSYKESSYRYEDKVMRPMLASYVFALLNDEQRRNIWKTRSVRKILEVPEFMQSSFVEELRNLQTMEQLALNSKIEYKNEIAVNDRFVIDEPRQFEGTYGYLVERRKRFLWVIKLEILGGFVTAEIDPREYKFTKS